MVGFAQLKFAPGQDKEAVRANVVSIAQSWLDSFQRSLNIGRAEWDDTLFAQTSWLKDSLVLDWSSPTIEGAASIKEYIQKNAVRAAVTNIRLPKSQSIQPTLVERGPLIWVESGFEFDTTFGTGRGIIRLANTALDVWSAWVVYLGLEELKTRPRRSLKKPDLFFESPIKTLDVPGEKTEPTVVIIGAGTAGLTVAACLQDCGVRTLLLDRDQQVGDSWRKRYECLKMQTASWMNTRPFFSGASNWPVFQSKDQFADYLESYASILELDVWTQTSFESAHYDDNARRWTVETVTVDNNRKRRTLRPRHLVWAGSQFYGPEPFLETMPGRNQFSGISYHAGEHKDAALLDAKGKKVVIIGANATAHDISSDFVQTGAHVTMVQRSPSIVHSMQATLQLLTPPPPDTMTVADYRFIRKTMPFPVQIELVQKASQAIVQFDKNLLDALDRTEFQASRCENGDNFVRRAWSTGGGFYVSRGGSELVASGAINVAFSSGGVKKFTGAGVVLADGRELEADIIVAATGYRRFENHLVEILGEDIARRATALHRQPANGDVSTAALMRAQKGIFTPTGHPGFWVAMGVHQDTVLGSEALALRILAEEDGLVNWNPERPEQN